MSPTGMFSNSLPFSLGKCCETTESPMGTMLCVLFLEDVHLLELTSNSKLTRETKSPSY